MIKRSQVIQAAVWFNDAIRDYRRVVDLDRSEGWKRDLWDEVLAHSHVYQVLLTEYRNRR